MRKLWEKRSSHTVEQRPLKFWKILPLKESGMISADECDMKIKIAHFYEVNLKKFSVT